MHGHEVVLITGGCGAIGSVVTNWLKEQYPETTFVNVDALTYCGRKDYIRPPYNNYRFYYGDITDSAMMSYVMETEQPTLLIHLAAETHVDQSFGNSFRFTHTNVLGTHVLLECAKNYGKFRKILHMSTDEVYGSVSDNDTCTESSMFAPSNPYSASKAAAEMICHAYEKSFKMPIIIMRCNNAISPFQHDEKLIPCCVDTIIRNMLGDKNAKIPIHGTGESKRTFVHAQDIASAIDTIAQKGSTGKIYNIGTGDDMEYSVMEVVETIVSMLTAGKGGVEEFVKYVPDRAFQDYRYCIDSSALRELGWKEGISFEEAIQDVIEYKKQRCQK